MKKNVYLYGSGELKRKDNSLVYITKSETKYIPVIQVDKVLVFGETKLSRKTMEFLNKEDIEVVYFTRFGNYIGRFIPSRRKLPDTIINQVEGYRNDGIRNNIVYKLESSIIHNEISLLKYYARRKSYTGIEALINEMEDILSKLSKDNINEMILSEARAKQFYYRFFDEIIKDADFNFVKRGVNPPLNRLNAMLSFGYSLLYSDILSFVDQSDMLPEISFTHGHTHHNNGALQYDLADLFKSQMIDRLCINLIMDKKIVKDDFYVSLPSGGVFLNEEGRKKMVDAYDCLLRKTITDKRNSRSYSYKQLLKREVLVLEQYINNTEEKYVPVTFKW